MHRLSLNPIINAADFSQNCVAKILSFVFDPVFDVRSVGLCTMPIHSSMMLDHNYQF